VRLLLDTNIVLDLLLERQPFFADAKPILAAIDDGQVVGTVTASSLTDIYYIGRKVAGKEKALGAIRRCLNGFVIYPVDATTLQTAVSMPDGDFEDNLQIACAIAANVDAIVTRDQSGFKSATLPVLSPKEVYQRISSTS
jgi:predicted nucleic acid-binding protein